MGIKAEHAQFFAWNFFIRPILVNFKDACTKTELLFIREGDEKLWDQPFMTHAYMTVRVVVALPDGLLYSDHA